ncbi:Ca2+-binding EF-hand superfamily protein [Haloferula luteola]|uniref:Ca2+-binding EF-hand superfamily protein n=1 Tax=Haloferula luteola TaxID=595692 RepID=A0A840V8I6_9BACT|nr:EF-hand domain-containing protein [Haloferula luteola]MBB5353366.1 Ca2+-binding EF-hand superfamily protein [Haloferula luteola]
MKTIHLLSTLALFSASASLLHAQEGPPEGKGNRGPRNLPPELIKKYDTDGDGKLSKEESTAMREEMKAKREALVKKYDTDGDGKLSPEERTAMRTALKAQYDAILEKYDADGDGKLSPEERKAAADAGEELPMAVGMDGPRGPRGEGRQRPNRQGPPPAPEEEAGE